MEQRGKVSEITFDRDRRKQQTGQAGNPHQKFQAWRKGKYTSVRYNHHKRLVKTNMRHGMDTIFCPLVFFSFKIRVWHERGLGSEMDLCMCIVVWGLFCVPFRQYCVCVSQNIKHTSDNLLHPAFSCEFDWQRQKLPRNPEIFFTFGKNDKNVTKSGAFGPFDC